MDLNVTLPPSRLAPQSAPADSGTISGEQQTIAELRQQLAQKSIEAAQQKFFLQKAREALVHLRQIVKILSTSPGSTAAPSLGSVEHGDSLDDPSAIATLLRAQQATIERLTHELRVARENVAESKAVAKLGPVSTSKGAENFVAIAFDQADKAVPNVDVFS